MIDLVSIKTLLARYPTVTVSVSVTPCWDYYLMVKNHENGRVKQCAISTEDVLSGAVYYVIEEMIDSVVF